MALKAKIAPELPFLRRYARAITGSQSMGDAAVRETLEALLHAPLEFDGLSPPRRELFRTFHKLWTPTAISSLFSAGPVATLPARARQCLLLTAVEGFSVADAAIILDVSEASTRNDLDQAHQIISSALVADIMIIEDEALIALDIQNTLEQSGHRVTSIARTHREAVHQFQGGNPELILADVSLADGSSGIDAVHEILNTANVPVIFVTAYPERLLTGEGVEPTYLITKPFESATLTATVTHVLLFDRERRNAFPRSPDADQAEPPADPRAQYARPSEVLDDPDLSIEEKQIILQQWQSEIDDRLRAEAEGMSAQDPITARDEASLADEANRVTTALQSLTEPAAQSAGALQ